jgi:hypothetical protein
MMKEYAMFVMLMLTAGCAIYCIPTPCGRVVIGTCCKDVKIPKIEGASNPSNMTLKIQGYAGDSDETSITATAESIGKIAGETAKTVIK